MLKKILISIIAIKFLFASDYSVKTYSSLTGLYGYGLPGGTAYNALNAPSGLVINGFSTYIADSGNNRIIQLSMFGAPSAIISALANPPTGITADYTGNLYVTDSTAGTVTKYDNGTWNPSVIIPGLTTPKGITADTLGNLYVVDAGLGAASCTVTKYANDGMWTTTTIANTLTNPDSVTVDSTGNVYVTSNDQVLKFANDGVWTQSTVAGIASTTGNADGNGATATFSAPAGIAVDSSGNLYVADSANNTIRMLTTSDGGSTWTVSTIAGTAGVIGSTDGTGGSASFHTPLGITMDTQGNIYVTDSGNNLIRMLSLPIPASILAEFEAFMNSVGPAGSAIFGATSSSIGSAIESARASSDESGGSNTDVSTFRFGLTPQRLKLESKKANVLFLSGGSLVDHNYVDVIKGVENVLSAVQPISQSDNGFSIWASGVYGQGQNKAMYTNPSTSDKHYGVMVGSHYYHKPTHQLIGLAIDVGMGNSFAKSDHKMKNGHTSSQATIYYGYSFTNTWHLDAHVGYMIINANHHRPYNSSNGVAKSNSKTHVKSAMLETIYEFKPLQTLHLKPSFGVSFVNTKQNAYSEKNAGSNNLHFNSASMTEVGLKFGFKTSIFQKMSEYITYGIYPSVDYVYYVKPGKMKQKAITISSGAIQILESSTPGRQLLTLGMGAGIENTEKDTKYTIGYTASFQRYRQGQEVNLKMSAKF